MFKTKHKRKYGLPYMGVFSGHREILGSDGDGIPIFFPYVIWVHEQAVSNDTHTLWAYFGIQKWMTLFEAVSWMAGWVAAGLGWRLDVKYTS